MRFQLLVQQSQLAKQISTFKDFNKATKMSHHNERKHDDDKGFFEAAADKTKLVAHNIKEGVKDLVGSNDKEDKVVEKTPEQRAADSIKEAADKTAKKIHEARATANDRMQDAAAARNQTVQDARGVAQDRMVDASDSCSKQVKDARLGLAEKMSDNAGYVAGH